MKHFFVAIFLLFGIFLFCPTSSVFASADNFARVTDEDVFLFKTQDFTDSENVLFTLPASYFVKILEEDDNCFYVEFDGILGYIQKEQVTKVYETPQNPFPKDITFEINKSVAAAIKLTPTKDSETLEFATSSSVLKFFGQTTGDEAISGLGNVWYFAELCLDDKTTKGYVYAPLTENLKKIPQNTETLPTTPPKTDDTSILSENITNPNNLWLVGVLFLIVMLLFLVTFLPFHLGRNKKSTNNIISKV